MSFIKTGVNALNQIQTYQQQAAADNAARSKFARLFVKPNVEYMLRFLKSDPASVYVHNHYNPGSNKYTKAVCTDPDNGCPICHIGHRPQSTGWWPMRYYNAPEYKGTPQHERMFIWEISGGDLDMVLDLIKNVQDLRPYIIKYHFTKDANGKRKPFFFIDPAKGAVPMDEVDNKLCQQLPTEEDWLTLIKAPTELEVQSFIHLVNIDRQNKETNAGQQKQQQHYQQQAPQVDRSAYGQPPQVPMQQYAPQQPYPQQQAYPQQQYAHPQAQPPQGGLFPHQMTGQPMHQEQAPANQSAPSQPVAQDAYPQTAFRSASDYV